MVSVGRAMGFGAAAAAAAGAAAAGVAVDRAAAARRRLGALDPADGFAHRADLELKVIASDGLNLHVEVDTPDDLDPALPTIVMSHGYCLSLRGWVLQRRAFVQAGYRVVLWDQRSHGESEKSELAHCTIDQLANDLRAVIDATCPDGPLVLVGHSMGGMTTMAFTRLHSELVRERVTAVAFVSTAAGGEGLTDLGMGPLVGRAIGQAGPRVLSRLAPHQKWLAPVRRIGRNVEDLLVDRFSFDSPVSEATVRFAADLILATPFEVMAAFLPALRMHDEHETLAALLDKQVLVINGTGDLLTPPQRSEEIVERLPGAEHVVVEESGHLIMLEHPEVVTGQILALIDRAEADAAAGIAVSDKPRVRRKVIDIAKGRLVRRAKAASKSPEKAEARAKSPSKASS
ncbi:putative hydrolase [Janibacter sp. HTCC2649]|uniref:alpha/beta fold hydrolase n=1 Tax=Janibacter sp. HTCC2649 TaxID=313589 RepID=UPI0000670E75|nr:putative hydrolase [Janibacter sp. HTCC2649]